MPPGGAGGGDAPAYADKILVDSDDILEKQKVVTEGALKVPVRGAHWLLGRMGISIALALINFLRFVLKLTIIPADSVYQRRTAEIGINLMRGVVTRPLIAYSLYYQWENP